MSLQKPTCSGVILAGGLNTRMQGRNKAFLEVGGRAIVDRLIEILGTFFAEILLVTRQPELYAGRPIRVVEDIYAARAALTGIHAGLRHIQTDFAFVVPCDAPFIEPALIRSLLAELEPHLDVIVPMVDHFYEPLCAVYSKKCLPAIEEQLNRGDYKISRLFERIRLKTIPLEKIMQADARKRAFFNVNTPEALAASRDMVQPQGAAGPKKRDPQDAS
ncbi:MAG: molybdenum cofactor guanylyltransferase [Desulfobacteraceae bacterium]|nr:MAG: molybdenum cofactor guanylyltransferase [Desulfobacteraceae bacterium]